MRERKSQPTNTGFTLVELLVVIVIVGILAGLLYPTVASALSRSKSSVVREELNHHLIALQQVIRFYGADRPTLVSSTPTFNGCQLARELEPGNSHWPVLATSYTLLFNATGKSAYDFKNNWIQGDHPADVWKNPFFVRTFIFKLGDNSVSPNAFVIEELVSAGPDGKLYHNVPKTDTTPLDDKMIPWPAHVSLRSIEHRIIYKDYLGQDIQATFISTSENDGLDDIRVVRFEGPITVTWPP